MQDPTQSCDLPLEYDRWNRALIDYATRSVPHGLPVFLSVDEESLLTIRQQFLRRVGGTAQQAVDEFTAALRHRCRVQQGQPLDLSWLRGADAEGRPRGIGLLAAMVLAAHRMETEEQDDDRIDESDYFRRLREVLGLPMEPGRPPGLKIDYTRVGHEPFAPEEPLWQAWNTWLNRNGWQSTADRGPGGLRKYINYPLSQALLRARDTVRLARVFREQERAGRLSRFWDRDLLAVHLDDLGDRLPPSRLRALLQTTTDPRRFDAIAEAAYEVYAALDWNRTDAEAETGDRTLGPRRLSAGLYRTEDFFSDTITYWLYPRMPRWWNGQSLSIRHGQESHPLRFQRAGWFHPLWPVDLSREHVDIVEGGDDIKTLVLPERDFWILGHDPEDDSSDVLATWRLPTLGETFLLLCQGQYAQQLALLHQEGLLLWDHVAEVTIGTQVWYEYHECMVLSSEWSGILPLNKGCKELLQTLQPTTTAAIILEGGLLVPGQHVWLDGYGPRMRICGFEPLVRLRVINLAAPAAPMRDEMVKANAQEGELLQLVPGEYLLEAWAGNRCVARRTFRTLSWDTLGEGQLPCQFGMPLGAFMLRGACLDPNEP